MFDKKNNIEDAFKNISNANINVVNNKSSKSNKNLIFIITLVVIVAIVAIIIFTKSGNTTTFSNVQVGRDIKVDNSVNNNQNSMVIKDSFNNINGSKVNVDNSK